MANSHGRIFVPVQLSQVSRIFSLPLAYTEQAAPKAAKTAARPRKGDACYQNGHLSGCPLLVNFLVAYFLLQAAGLLSSQHAAFSRMVCASGIASLSALILFAPELSYPAQILYKILTACAVVGVAFGLQGLRRFVTAVCWYAALNILLAGLCIAVILRTGTPLLQTANLTVYLRISPVVLLLLSAASCGAVWLVLHFSGSTPQTTRTIGIEFELCGAPVRLRATLDTGCHLKDPVTCLPVLLISWPAAKADCQGESTPFWGSGSRACTPVHRRSVPVCG